MLLILAENYILSNTFDRVDLFHPRLRDQKIGLMSYSITDLLNQHLYNRKILMKKILVALIMLGSASAALHAQSTNVEYKVTRDDPSDICNFWMFLDPFQMDFGFKNIDGASFNTGITGMGWVHKRFGFDYGFRYGTLTLGKLKWGDEAKNALAIELGGLLTIGDRTRMKSNTKVVLSVTNSTNSNGDNVETTKFIRIPAQQRVLTHVRGGLYFKRNPFSQEVDEMGNDVEANLTCMGIYIGLSRTAVSNVFLNTNTDGKASRSGMFRFYADVIICPVRKLDTFQGSASADAAKLGSPVGFRMGFYGMPCEDRAVKKKKAFAAGVEVGFRPGDGLYCTGSWMFPLVRRKLTAFGYVRPSGTNEKGQVIEKE